MCGGLSRETKFENLFGGAPTTNGEQSSHTKHKAEASQHTRSCPSFIAMWCPIRMGSLCMGLEQESPCKWQCEICSRIATAVDKQNAIRSRWQPPIDREHTRVDIPEPQPTADSLSERLESHYQSLTHKRCVVLLLGVEFGHADDVRNKVADWLDPLVDSLTVCDDRDKISRQMYLYVRSGQNNVKSGEYLASALTLLHKSMQLEIRTALALASCKQLAIALARAEPLDSPTAFASEDDIRSFLLGRQDAWKRHKATVREGGRVNLIVLLVLPFLPEFVKPGFAIASDSHQNAKRRRVQESSSASRQQREYVL
jgi:hypothetical protein